MNLSKIIQLLRMNSILDVEGEEGIFPRGPIGTLEVRESKHSLAGPPLSPRVSGSGRKPGHQEAFLPPDLGLHAHQRLWRRLGVEGGLLSQPLTRPPFSADLLPQAGGWNQWDLQAS